jgi:hypothetical protein
MPSIRLSAMRGSSTLLLRPTIRRVVVLIEAQFSRCSYTDFGDVGSSDLHPGCASIQNFRRAIPFLERLARRTKALRDHRSKFESARSHRSRPQ